jgi:hypothetical protein
MKVLQSFVFILYSFSSTLAFSQSLELGILSTFQAYTGSGAVTNSGICIGDVGTDNGIITGCVGPNFTGTTYNSNAMTVTAREDLLRVYIHLSRIFVTYPGTHAPAFGAGETITPGVYSIGGAGSVSGTLTLDGAGDPNAVFIIKFDGAFTAAVGTTIVLSGGTRACNVFWISEGALSIDAGSTIKGTLISHPGAISLGANCDVEGRLFATEGAITIGAGGIAVIGGGTITIPINCVGVCAPHPSVDVLGSVAKFALFTSAGAVSNAATSGIVGDIGSDIGAVSGFITSTQIGSAYTAGLVTAQAKIDLVDAYNQLILLPNTQLGHGLAFGSGETLTAGVYYMGGAGSLAGTVTLDGQNNPNAVFVFKFNGAFSVAAQAKVILTNGTRRCNVFWISEGATDMGTFSYMKGTVLAHGGACTMAANGNLEGRMLSTAGAIGFSTGTAYNNELCFTPSNLPIELLSFDAKVVGSRVMLNWITASEINNDYFTVDRSADGINFTSISKINGVGNSTKMLSYSSIDDTPLDGISYYRLIQTDFNGETSSSKLKAVEFNESYDFHLKIYPNPFTNETTFQTTKPLEDASLIVSNSYGQIVKQEKNISGQRFTMNRENLSLGIYFIKLVKEDGNVIATSKLVIVD